MAQQERRDEDEAEEIAKKAISKGCCSLDAMRITACIDAKPMVAPSNSSMPRVGGGRAR